MSISPYKGTSAATVSSSSSSSSSINNNNHGRPQSQPPNSMEEEEDHHHQLLPQSQSSLSLNNISEALPPAEHTTTASSSSRKVNDGSSESSSRGIKLVGQRQQHNNRWSSRSSAEYREKKQHHDAETVVVVGAPHNIQHSSDCTNTTTVAGRKTHVVKANHLLNFHYEKPIPSRSKFRNTTPPFPSRFKRKPYNKDLFLQANYKFVLLLDDSGLHSPDTNKALDPDKMLIWEDIICVKFSTPFPVHCPICLDDPPLCPQITCCGHIFCFPCILRYFFTTTTNYSAGDDYCNAEVWKKCPLCFVMISSKDLYTIYIDKVKQLSIGDTAEFMLLTRQKGSCILSLKNKESVGVPDKFSKFTFTSDVDLSVRNAVSDLDSWLARADSGLVDDDLEKLPYVCGAVEQLQQRRKYWNERRAGLDSDAQQQLQVGGKATLDQSVELAAEDEDSRSVQSNSDGQEKDSYSFYQAIDGQHLILHPLNLKCLLHHYGSYDKLPHRISGKIMQLDSVTQSEAMRRRYRYLSHFSLTTTFQFCEIDLGGSLTRDALSPFMDEIKNREKERKRIAKKERQEKLRADAAAASDLANHMAATIPYNNIAVGFHDDSPTFTIDDFEALGGGTPFVASSSPPTTAPGEKMHFANVARLGFAAGHDSPALRIDCNTTPWKPRPETASNSSVAIGGATRKNGDNPSFANIISRGKDIQDADETTAKTNETTKKGKKPTRVLMSTGGGRRY